MTKFHFDVNICKTCKFFDGDVGESGLKLDLYYCSKLLEYIDSIDGTLQRYAPMKITSEIREEWAKGYDRRVLFCPYHLEHVIAQENKS